MDEDETLLEQRLFGPLNAAAPRARAPRNTEGPRGAHGIYAVHALSSNAGRSARAEVSGMRMEERMEHAAAKLGPILLNIRGNVMRGASWCLAGTAVFLGLLSRGGCRDGPTAFMPPAPPGRAPAAAHSRDACLLPRMQRHRRDKRPDRSHAGVASRLPRMALRLPKGYEHSSVKSGKIDPMLASQVGIRLGAVASMVQKGGMNS